jgi:hypothetical protein
MEEEEVLAVKHFRVSLHTNSSEKQWREIEPTAAGRPESSIPETQNIKNSAKEET